MTSFSQRRNQLTKDYLNQLDGLNEKQKEAVHATDGPVLTIAGPGTGKTQILGLRIAHILHTTDVSANNILCLTFTEAGATQMRKRVAKFIGDDLAEQITIATFHGFCNAIIMKYPSLFSPQKQLRVADDLTYRLLMKDLFDNFEVGHILTLGYSTPYVQLDPLRQFFDTMHKERDIFFNRAHPDITSLCKFLQKYMDNLANMPEFQYKKNTANKQKGDPKDKDIKNEKKRVVKFIAALHAFERFEKMLSENGLYTYSHMLAWVDAALQNDKELSAQYQEQYQYILVDEFQDTNGTQLRILHSLTEVWGRDANIFAVGDENQSIYRFQGAEEKNLLDFKQRFHPKEIRLRDNYRSTQPILDAARALILHNYATPPFPVILQSYSSDTAPQPVMLHACESEEASFIDLVERIKKLRTRGANEIAVLSYKHNHLHRFIRYLEVADIPYSYDKKNVVLQHVFIRALIALARYISYEHKNKYAPISAHVLFEIMYAPVMPYGVQDIAAFWQAVREDKKHSHPRAYYHAHKKIWQDKFPLFAQLENLIAQYKKINSHDFFDVLVARLDLQKWIKDENTSRYFEAFKNFYKQRLQDYGERAQQENNTPWGVYEFMIEVLDEYEKEGLQPNISVNETQQEGVQIHTAHGSKGREFDYVFLISATDKAWKKPGNGGKISLPKTCLHYLEEVAEETPQDKKTKEDEKEFRRLAYVALTRARKELHISYHENADTTAAFFVQEIKAKAKAVIQEDKPNIRQEQIDAFCEKLYTFSPLAHNAYTHHETLSTQIVYPPAIAHFIQHFQLSHSTLSQYENCASAFYFEKILAIPTPEKESFGTQLGLIIHRVIYLAHKTIKAQKKIISYEVFLRLFKEAKKNFFVCEDPSQPLSTHEQNVLLDAEKRLRGVYDYLNTFYQQHDMRFVREEEKVSGAWVYENGKIPIKGFIDLIYQDAQQFFMIDYKTSKKASVTEGHKDQAMFYYDLLSICTDYKKAPNKMIFVFIDEDGNITEEEICFSTQHAPHAYNVITEEDLQAHRARMQKAWNEITSAEMIKKCENENCPYCAWIQQRM